MGGVRNVARISFAPGPDRVVGGLVFGVKTLRPSSFPGASRVQGSRLRYKVACLVLGLSGAAASC